MSVNGLNDPDKHDANCDLAGGGRYIAYDDFDGKVLLFDRKKGKKVPTGLKGSNPSVALVR